MFNPSRPFVSHGLPVRSPLARSGVPGLARFCESVKSEVVSLFVALALYAAGWLLRARTLYTREILCLQVALFGAAAGFGK